MHHLLRKQILDHLGVSSETVPEEWKPFLDAVNRVYYDFNREEGLLEKNIALSEKELMERHLQLELEKKRADDANSAKSSFLANMSHELRTPLNAIIGYSEILLEDTKEDEAHVELVQDVAKIKSAGVHLLELINSILDLSKIEAGKIEVNIETVSIIDSIQSIKAIVQPLVEKNNNTFTVELGSNLGDMVTDSMKVRQILFNILSNASKFTSNGDIVLTVTTASIAGAESVVFEVRDTGVGMSVPQLKRVFHPFEQADSSTTRKYGGTGLGLTITKQFCELLGGGISVKSKSSEGTTFTVVLPKVYQGTTTSEDEQVITEEGHSVLEEKDRILVIESDAPTQLLLHSLLSHEGCEVDIAEDVTFARQLLGNRVYRLIVWDVSDLDQSVYDKEVSENVIWREVPIVLLSQTAKDQDIVDVKTMNIKASIKMAETTSNIQLIDVIRGIL